MELSLEFCLVLAMLFLEILSAGWLCVQVGVAGIPALLAFCRRRQQPRRLPPQDPDVLREERKLLAARRVVWANVAVVGLWIAAGAMCAPLVIDALAGRIVVTPSLLVRGVGLLLFTTLGIFRTFCLRDRTLPVVHTLCMAYVCGVAYGQRFDGVSDFQAEWVLFFSLAVACLCLRRRLCISTNSVLLVVSVAREVLEGGRPVGTCAKQVLYFLGTVAVIHAIVTRAEAAVRKEVEEGSGQCLQSAVLSLLDRTCDAVVDTDGELRLKAHAPKLSGMLMHTGRKSLQGCPLASSIADAEDTERFEEVVRQSRAGDGDGVPSAGMLTVRMRDALGNIIRVVLLLVPYTNIGGRTHHLVGVREDVDEASPYCSDGPRMPTAVLRPEIARDLALGQPSTGMVAGEDGRGLGLGPRSAAGVAASARSRRSSRSAGSASSRVCSRSNGPDPTMVCGVLTEPGLPVKFASPALLEEFGVTDSALRQLGDCFADGGSSIRSWMQGVVNDEIQIGTKGEFIRYYGTVEFRIPSTAGPSIPLRRRVWVFFPENFEETDAVAIGIGRLGLAAMTPNPAAPSGATRTSL